MASIRDFAAEQGMQVHGFTHPAGTNEDGWLALKLREKGFGYIALRNGAEGNGMDYRQAYTDRRRLVESSFQKAEKNDEVGRKNTGARYGIMNNKFIKKYYFVNRAVSTSGAVIVPLHVKVVVAFVYRQVDIIELYQL